MCIVLRAFVALIALSLVSGCAGYKLPPSAHHSSLVAPYQLDSGDVIRVIVFSQNDLTNSYTVSQAGKISMPLIGEVVARGLTTAKLEERVTAMFKSGGYLIRPDVSVEVTRYRPFFAMGEVSAGGQYSYVAGLTVQQAIAVAGGFTPRADRRYVQVTRSRDGELQTFRLTMTDPVYPGDTLYIRERIF